MSSVDIHNLPFFYIKRRDEQLTSLSITVLVSLKKPLSQRSEKHFTRHLETENCFPGRTFTRSFTVTKPFMKFKTIEYIYICKIHRSAFFSFFHVLYLPQFKVNDLHFPTCSCQGNLS